MRASLPSTTWRVRAVFRHTKDFRRKNSAEFFHSIYYATITRIYKLGKKKLTVVGCLLLVPSGSEPPLNPISRRL
jgi:hypothetical protein